MKNFLLASGLLLAASPALAGDGMQVAEPVAHSELLMAKAGERMSPQINPYYIKYICQKCGQTVTVAKTNVPPYTQCREGGRHKWKRVPK
jgi:DNA-directed RNA polymerase subunit RPC12/RpoP